MHDDIMKQSSEAIMLISHMQELNALENITNEGTYMDSQITKTHIH